MTVPAPPRVPPARRPRRAARARGAAPGRGRRGPRRPALLLAGEAGIGKTRLLAAIERRAAAEGAVVVRGVAFPRDVDTAGGVLLDLARSLARVPRLAAAGSELRARLRRRATRAATRIAGGGSWSSTWSTCSRAWPARGSCWSAWRISTGRTT